ncbi:hypothetical protein Tco_0970490 [Tanacetum coccineum]
MGKHSKNSTDSPHQRTPQQGKNMPPTDLVIRPTTGTIGGFNSRNLNPELVSHAENNPTGLPSDSTLTEPTVTPYPCEDEARKRSKQDQQNQIMDGFEEDTPLHDQSNSHRKTHKSSRRRVNQEDSVFNRLRSRFPRSMVTSPQNQEEPP